MNKGIIKKHWKSRFNAFKEDMEFIKYGFISTLSLLIFIILLPFVIIYDFACLLKRSDEND